MSSVCSFAVCLVSLMAAASAH